MSTIDPNDLNARSMARLWMNYTTVKEERDNWREQAEKAEQEIARLQDQLATARGLISLAEAVCTNYSEAGTAKRLRDFLAAIPTSDRERLLEEARALFQEAYDQDVGDDWDNAVSKWLAKLPK